ncbi:TonB-linked outer membrane protein, SusC/RagA family [Nonlabens sp. Hel1_33_55]|uniref:SusC/RagA family TonB-linked outer membrane protein n=1 Tax=Nonlabens sp. Hel1_33_55 TaxID=1336802 RepID=UPI000875C4D1|nr:TonB-dependent receptor [Nonlabens sp. Hel1_33_55]SCY32481.1 TonB-linked outer membrane protein, SusC/RagA family [Nonlabens sp. Hel1_33_55]
MKKLTFLLIYLLATVGFAQGNMISGKVVEQSTGEVLLGATVQNLNNNSATTTDFDGLFTIPGSDGDVLRISYIGKVAKQVTIANSSFLTISLLDDVASLDEIVVVGYGTQAVREITGAVSIVDSEVIENLKPTRVEEALQGQVPGVNVTSSSGSPGAGLNIRIRGISTNGDNRPLILVDGNIIEDLSVINPGDIESISVLKDATAGIYGVRAANGVIIITTKGGRKNQDLTVEFNSWGGFQETSRKLPTLNAQQYALLKNEAFANNGQALPFTDISNLTDTDYQDEVFDNALILNNDVSVRGGTEKSVYAFGMAALLQDGIVGSDKSDFDRFTLRGNFDHDWTDNLKMKTGFLYSHTSNKGINDGGLGSVLFNALNMAPTIPVRDENGDFSIAEGLGNEVINPEAQLANTYNRNYVGKISGNFGLTYSFLENFEATARIQANYSEASGNNFNPRAFYGSGKVFNLTENVYSEYENFFSDYTYDAFVKYDNTFNDVHNVEATLGMSAFRTRGDFNGFTGFGNESNEYNEVSLEGADRIIDGDENGARRFDQRLLSHFVRVQYDYDGKYLFSAVIRRDGSTIFGPENRFGYFPSASIGWVASDEEFLADSEIFDFLKFRASAGLIGNDRIPAFGYVSLLTGEGQYVFNGQIINGTASGALSNPEIKWEEQFTTNFGVDMQFFSNKMNVTLDYYRRETRDLLIAPAVSGILGSGAPGSSAPFINGGDIRNTGIEFLIGYSDDLTDDFSFNASYNFATLDNEVLFVNNDNGFIEAGGFGVGQPPITRFEEGFPIGYFYGFQTDGIFQNADEVAAHPSQSALGANAQPGDFRYLDTNNDGEINLDDRVELGNPLPDVTMGLNLSFNYKNWDFQSYFFASIGNDMVRNYERNQPLTNLTTNALNRWTGEGSTNSFPRVTTGATANQVFSDFFVEDASFVRAQNLQLGYTLGENALSNVQLSSLRIYGSVRNAFTLTEYRGFDPSASSGDPLASGIDNGFYPVARTFLVGVNAKF